MSGGIAYVYDEDGTFATRCNASMVALLPVLPEAEQARADKELARPARPICGMPGAPTSRCCAS